TGTQQNKVRNPAPPNVRPTEMATSVHERGASNAQGAKVNPLDPRFLTGSVAPATTKRPIPTHPANGATHHSNVSVGNDTCAAATAIAGTGNFAGDNIGATTDGPSNCGAMSNDVWYNWTATASGPTTFSLCGSSYDTQISIYDTAACTGALLACNDDFCNLQSQATVCVTQGNVYKIQI